MNKIIFKQQTGSHILLIFTFCLIWLVSPLISFANTFPFKNPLMRLAIIIVIFIGYNHKKIFKLLYHTSKLVFIFLINLYKKLFFNAKSFNCHKYKLIKQALFNNDFKRLSFKENYLYLIIGEKGAGKTSAIINSDLHFPAHEQIDKHSLSTQQQEILQNWNFIFSQEAIFVEIESLSNLLNQLANDNILLIKFLKKVRNNKIINSIIICCDITEYIKSTTENQIEYCKKVKSTLLNIQTLLSNSIAVYLFFTKIDLVAGFTAFFQSFEKNEREQAWGISFPLHILHDASSLAKYFQIAYKDLLTRLNLLVSKRLMQEHDHEHIAFLLTFPSQLETFTIAIENFLVSIFADDDHYNDPHLQLRGFYFISATQEGKSFDFINSILSTKLNTDLKTTHTQTKQNNSFFIKKIFKEVIFPEAKWVSIGKYQQKMQNYIYRLCLPIIPLLGLLLIFLLVKAYHTSKHNLTTLNLKIANFENIQRNVIKNDYSLLGLLPILDAWQEITALNSGQWMPYFFMLPSYFLHIANIQAMQRLLSHEFMPEISYYLYQLLGNPAESDHQLYSQLKAYLSFSNHVSKDINWIKNPVIQAINENFNSQPIIQNQLQYYLNLALKQPIPTLPLDRNLILKIQERLKRTLPVTRTYNLLIEKTSSTSLPVIDFPLQIGEVFNDVFKISGKLTRIPALYTIKGYHDLYLINYLSVINQIIQDDWVLGITENLSLQTKQAIITQLNILYAENYLHYWQQLLNNIQIIKFQDLSQAIDILTILTNNQSPIPTILNTVLKNTANLTIQNINLSSQFAPINTIALNQSQNKLLNNTLAGLTQLLNYLDNIKHATDVSQAEFQAANDYLIDSAGKEPLKQLQTLSEQLPFPLNNWISQIVDNSLALLFEGAGQVINSNWQQKIIPYYQAHIQGYFPFSNNATSQVKLTDFINFFASHGILDNFFQQYLKPFTNTTLLPWQWYLPAARGLNLDNSILNSFTQVFAIRNLYFSNSTMQPLISFNIEPLTLDAQSASVSLQFGSQQLNYRHGPAQNYEWHWPMIDNTQAVTITFTDFQDNNYTLTYTGTWAWFKLLAASHLQEGKTPDSLLLTVTLQNHYAVFLISSEQDLSFFNLSLLDNFNLPDQLSSQQKLAIL